MSVIQRWKIVAAFFVMVSGVSPRCCAQEAKDAQPWSAPQDLVKQLGDQFSDERISIRPPRGYLKATMPKNDVAEKASLILYGWTPGGVFPSLANVSVTLLPPPTTASKDLDELVKGFVDSVTRNLTNVQMSPFETGKFIGGEARRGRYTGTVNGEARVAAVIILFSDAHGTVAVSAMHPIKDGETSTPELLEASMLTFERVR